MAKILIPKETRAGETRVAATPETVKRLIKAGFEVTIEAGAGEASYLPDTGYEEVGGKIVSNDASAWGDADVVLKVGPLATNEIEALKPEAIVVGLLDPYRESEMVRQLASKRITSLAMELVPRITRAQSMDALSSQANIAGYKAVILAASRLSRYFPLLMTAAATIPPA
jgi:NAD(P) transhydrogenase subunit alpha